LIQLVDTNKKNGGQIILFIMGLIAGCLVTQSFLMIPNVTLF